MTGAGRSRWCRWARLLLCGLVLGGAGVGVGIGREGELLARFDSGVESVAFVLSGGREVVTVGVAGSELGAVTLVGRDPAPRLQATIEPASRLVLLRSDVPLGAGVALAARAPGSGELRVGHGGGTCRIEQRVKRIHGKYLPFTLLRVRYPGAVARMGTPLFGSDGKVAAVAHLAAEGSTGFALPVEVLERFLDGVRQAGKPQRARLGLSLHPGSPTPRVTAVAPSSPAARAGFRTGDVLTAAAGRPVHDYGDAVNAFFLMLPGRTVNLTVNRGGQSLKLPLTPAAQ